MSPAMATGHVHEHADGLARAVAWRLAELADAGLRARGHATLVLAGGGTPLPAYRRWARDGQPDGRVQLLPTDERWVPAVHPACNLAALRACFDGPSGPAFLPLVPERAAGEPATDVARASLAQVRGDFDGVLLGMGEDGHFASLFPGDPGLVAALDPASREDVVVGRPQPLPANAPFPRISLTLARLLRARAVLLVVTGAAKRDLLTRARTAPDPARWPVSALLAAAGAALEIHWSP